MRIKMDSKRPSGHVVVVLIVSTDTEAVNLGGLVKLRVQHDGSGFASGWVVLGRGVRHAPAEQDAMDLLMIDGWIRKSMIA